MKKDYRMPEIHTTELIRQNWIHVHYDDDSFTVELHKWMKTNMTNNWAVDGWSGVIGCIIYFEEETDAMAFKLRWI